MADQFDMTYADVVSVHVLEEFQTEAHRLVVIGRDPFNGRRCFLTGEGKWQPITEYGAVADDGAMAGSPPYGIRLPRGVLDAIVSKHNSTKPPHVATERHLDDAIAVRDRLLSLVETRPTTIVTEPKAIHTITHEP